MAQLETETRKCIDEYYNKKVEHYEFIKRQLQKEYKIRVKQDFENDEDVIQIHKLIEKLRRKYNKTYIHLKCECELSDWELERSNIYMEMKEYKYIEKEIQVLRNERALLITELEGNPKNSKEYRQALEKCQKLFK